MLIRTAGLHKGPKILGIVSILIFHFIRRSLPAEPSQSPQVLCGKVCDLPRFKAWMF